MPSKEDDIIKNYLNNVKQLDEHNKYYYDKDRLRKNGKFLYFWTLTDYLKPFKGILSQVGYVKLDFSIFRFKDLRIRTYNKSMGEGKITYVFTPKNEWRYPKPKSSGDVLYKEICKEHLDKLYGAVMIAYPGLRK